MVRVFSNKFLLPVLDFSCSQGCQIADQFLPSLLIGTDAMWVWGQLLLCPHSLYFGIHENSKCFDFVMYLFSLFLHGNWGKLKMILSPLSSSKTPYKSWVPLWLRDPVQLASLLYMEDHQCIPQVPASWSTQSHFLSLKVETISMFWQDGSIFLNNKVYLNIKDHFKTFSSEQS